jgi:hypothetical protein
LAKFCCKAPHCNKTNFTVFEIQQTQAQYNNNKSEQDKTTFLHQLLHQMEVKNKNDTHPQWIIEGIAYHLAVHDKPVCSKRFAIMYGCSHNKVVAAVQQKAGTASNPPTPTHAPTKVSVRDHLVSELEQLFDKCAIETPQKDKSVRFLYGFHTKKDVYEQLMAAALPVPGDTVFHISLSYFEAIWREKFPDVWIAGETLCSTCHLLTSTITSLGKHDPIRHQKEEELRIHNKHAQDQIEFSNKTRDNAKSKRLPILSIVMDYKGGDPVPARHPSTYEFSSIPRLVIHYAGLLNDNTGELFYKIHTEHWPESANTVITSLNRVLTGIAILQPDLVLHVDGHSTNMNRTVYGYL